jgi:NAD(P)-dependent dehydrogenase (short-subunit alcohol dehydrogenase family)
MADGRLAGKTALITGATGALGSGFARSFAAHGADLVLTSRTEKALEDLADEIRSSTGRRVAVVTADLCVDGDPERLAQEAWDAFGNINVVVGNAVGRGHAQAGDILTTPESSWMIQYETIVWGPLRMLRGLAPRMMDAGGGSIISIVATPGYSPRPGLDAYGLAKASLIMLTKYMAKEWGSKGIRANSLNPGPIASRDNEEEMRSLAERYGVLQRTSMGRVGQSPELIDAAVFLASDEASYISGQLLSVDGGFF